MITILFGVVLLIGGIVATAVSPNTYYYGAIAVGVITIIRGAMQLQTRQAAAAPPAPRNN